MYDQIPKINIKLIRFGYLGGESVGILSILVILYIYFKLFRDDFGYFNVPWIIFTF